MQPCCAALEGRASGCGLRVSDFCRPPFQKLSVPGTDARKWRNNSAELRSLGTVDMTARHSSVENVQCSCLPVWGEGTTTEEPQPVRSDCSPPDRSLEDTHTHTSALPDTGVAEISAISSLKFYIWSSSNRTYLIHVEAPTACFFSVFALCIMFVLLLNVFSAVKCHGHVAWWPPTPSPLSAASHRCDPSTLCPQGVHEVVFFFGLKYLDLPKTLHSLFASAVAFSAAGLHQNICTWDFPACTVYLLHPGSSEPLKPAGKIGYF